MKSDLQLHDARSSMVKVCPITAQQAVPQAQRELEREHIRVERHKAQSILTHFDICIHAQRLRINPEQQRDWMYL